MSHMTEHVGRVVGGRYRLLAPLGSGASAEVYLADDVRLRRRVAVKILHTVLADDEAFLRRFRAEARAVAALSHPNLLAIYDWNGDELPPYLVTEYLSGGSLRSMLDEGHRLSPSQALLVGLQTAQALDHAHRQGFIHRDIKPANLLFGGERRLRIADFGLARAVAEAGWTEPNGAVLGTARYASPEQVRGESLDGRSDVYSLGLVMIEAVTGNVPFSADTTIGTLMARLDRTVEVPEEMDELVPLLEKAGTPDRDERPDAAALVNALVDAATRLPRPETLPIVRSASTTREGEEDSRDRTMLGVPMVPTGPPATNGQDGTAPMPLPSSSGDQIPPPPPMLHPVPRLRRFRARPWLLRTLAILLTLAVGVAGAWLFFLLRVPSHEVPDLRGEQISNINGRVGEFGWRIDQNDVYQDDTEQGEVLRTSPEPGANLREGETLRVTVSLGPSLVTLPTEDEIKGFEQHEVEEQLTGLELKAEFVDGQDHETQRDEVIGYAEDTPDRVPKGSTVQVVVDEGGGNDDDDNGNGNGNGDIEVPDVLGRTLEEAKEDIEDAGLKVGDVDGPDDGWVWRTDPWPGTRLEEDDKVDIWAN